MSRSVESGMKRYRGHLIQDEGNGFISMSTLGSTRRVRATMTEAKAMIDHAIEVDRPGTKKVFTVVGAGSKW